eukprot:4584878-Pleurochrysis_carterae.AAC.2
MRSCTSTKDQQRACSAAWTCAEREIAPDRISLSTKDDLSIRRRVSGRRNLRAVEIATSTPCAMSTSTVRSR